MTAGVLPVIAINPFIGFSIPFIDNSAHRGLLTVAAWLTLIISGTSRLEERVFQTRGC